MFVLQGGIIDNLSMEHGRTQSGLLGLGSSSNQKLEAHLQSTSSPVLFSYRTGISKAYLSTVCTK